MKTVKKIEQAMNLKEEVLRYADLLQQFRNSEHDSTHQNDRVKLNAVALSEDSSVVLSGAARFKKCGSLRALGVRQTEQGSAGSVELTMRTMRTKTAIVKKTIDPERRNSTVATAWFRFDGGVIRYQEETRRRKSTR